MQPKVKTWLRQIEIGNIKSNHARVLSYIKRCVMATNIHQLREQLNISHQSLTATLSELMDNGLVKSVGDGILIKGNTYSELKFVYNEEERLELSMNRRRDKFKQWLNKGFSDYNELLPINVSIQLQQLYYQC